MNRWLRRAVYLLVATALLLGGAMAWLRHGWSEDQWRVAEVRAGMAVPTHFEATWESISPWLTARLPSRIGVYLRRVVKVELYCEQVAERDFRNVGQFAFLRELSLSGERVDDAGLAQLKGLSRLERLDLGGGGFTDAGIENLKGLRRLQDLTILGGKMTNAGLEWLNDLPRLKAFTICGNAVDREGLLPWLRRHPRVEVVDGPGGPLQLDAGGSIVK